MADTALPQLPAATALTGVELIYGVQNSGDVKITATQIAALSPFAVGTTSITGGVTTRLLYDNAGKLGETNGLTWDSTNLALNLNGAIHTGIGAAVLQLGAVDAAAPVAQTLQVQSVLTGTSNAAGAATTIRGSLGTGTGAAGVINFAIGSTGNTSGSSQNVAATLLSLQTFSNLGSDATANIAITPTWNTSGAPTAIKLNVVNTASSGSALLLDLQVGGSSKLNVRADGTLTVNSSFGIQCNNFYSTGGAHEFDVGVGAGPGIQIVSGGALSIAGDTILTRPAAAAWQFGAADAASPAAQTLQVQNVVAGTSNTGGANWTLNGSLSTGSGTSGDIILQTGGTGAGATSQNALVTAMTIKGATQQVIFAGTPRVNVAPTANTSASTTITSGADSSSNCGHRLQLNLNGTTYWIPCSSVAF